MTDGPESSAAQQECPRVRLRRAQALAADFGMDLRITRTLIAAKLARRARLAREEEMAVDVL
jgi:hypothetical protein